MQDSDLNYIENKLNSIISKMEKMQIAEYIEIVKNPRRMFLIGLITGISRGLGFAVGFVLLGAVMIWMLGKIAVLNIPIIGDYITEIVKIVMEQV